MNSNISISNLYHQLIRKFNFSIGGYSNPEKQVSDFFFSLCKNELIFQNQAIKLLMFGFAQLNINDINEIDLERWETIPLSKFNYFDYSSGYAEVLLSLYIHCLNEICANKRATNIISENIRRDINLRVIIDKSQTNFIFKENKRLEALEIIVPGNIYNDLDSPLDINSFIDDKGDSINNFVAQTEEYEYEYKINNDRKKKLKKNYEALARKVLRVQPHDFLEGLKSGRYLPNEHLQKKIKERTLKNPDANLEAILAVAYSASLFCYAFDCSMEYFVSVSNVALDKKNSLGSIAVGIKNDKALSFDERAMFSIISNHIASNLSAQIIFENNRDIKRAYLRNKIRSVYDEFKSLGDSQALHGTKVISSQQFKSLKSYVELNENVFGTSFLKHFTDLRSLNHNYVSKYCLVELKSSDFCDCKIAHPNHLFYLDDDLEKFNCHNAIGEMKYINIPFVNMIFYRLTRNRNDLKCEILDRKITQNKIVFNLEYSKSFPIDEFYTKLKKSHNGDLIGTCFIDNYFLLDAHGIFQILTEDDIILFDSREMIKTVVDRKLVINDSGFIYEIMDLRRVKLMFINELVNT